MRSIKISNLRTAGQRRNSGETHVLLLVAYGRQDNGAFTCSNHESLREGIARKGVASGGHMTFGETSKSHVFDICQSPNHELKIAELLRQFAAETSEVS